MICFKSQQAWVFRHRTHAVFFHNFQCFNIKYRGALSVFVHRLKREAVKEVENQNLRRNRFFHDVFKRNIITWIALLLVVLTALIFFLIHISNDVEEEEGRVLTCPTSKQEIVWLISCGEGKVVYCKNGMFYTVSADISNRNEDITDTYVVLSYENNNISGIRPVKEVKSGRLLSYSENSVKIWEKNKEEEYEYGEDLAVLEENDSDSAGRMSVRNSISESDISQLGSREAVFFMEEDRLVGIMVVKQKQTMIRVLLNAGYYKGLYHKKVVISCSEAFTMSCGKRTKQYKKGKKLIILPENSLLKQDSLIFTSKNGGRFTIEGISRAEKPVYPGSIELVKRDKGIMVINELPLEDYLCRVVNSEMPESFGLEALKAQAVCARSYAAIKLKTSEYHVYGADVDDSTLCQVYNNQAMNTTTVEAVRATKGQVLWKDGHVETAYYFSTSCGHTSTVDQVWGKGEESEDGNWQIDVFSDSSKNDGEAKEVIKRISQKNLSKEEVMTAFLLGETPFSDEHMLEKDEPWYRWQVSMSKKEWGDAIKKNLQEATKNPNTSIFKKNSNGKWENVRISDFGTLNAIKVLKREKSGLVTEIELKGTKASVKLCGEYMIRKILLSEDAVILRQDNTKVEDFPLLPSAYFSFRATKNGWVLYGGGYGHGVGMSQYGAKDLAKKGCTYRQILGFYYPGCMLKEGF